MVAFTKNLTARDTLVFMLVGLGLLVAGVDYFTKFSNKIEALGLGGVALLAIGIYWFVGGRLSQDNYISQSRWRRGIGLGIVSFLIILGLYGWQNSNQDSTSSRAILEFAWRLMFLGAFATNQVLLIEGRLHPKSTSGQ